MYKKEKKSQGIVLVTTMLVISLVVMLLSTILYANFGSLRLSSNFYDREQALMAAQSGVQYAISRLEQDKDWCAKDQENFRANGIEVLERKGNVIGLITGPSGQKSAFRIKFNYEDSRTNEMVEEELTKNLYRDRIKSPFVSVNNVSNPDPTVAYLANDNGQAVAEDMKLRGNEGGGRVGHTVPAHTCDLVVEGFAGNVIRGNSLSECKDKIPLATRRVVEVYLSASESSDSVDSVIAAAGGLEVFTNSFKTTDAKGGFHSNVRSLGDVTLNSKSIANGGTVFYNGNLTVNGGGNGGLACESSKDGSRFPRISWDKIPKANSTNGNKLPSGTYVFEEVNGRVVLKHYVGYYPDYKSFIAAKNGEAGTVPLRESAEDYSAALTVTANEYDIVLRGNTYVSGDVSILSAVNKYGTRPTIHFARTGKEGVIFSSSGNIAITGALIGNGSITSEKNISVQGPSLFESDPNVGVSIYAKQDINFNPILNTTKRIENVLSSPTSNALSVRRVAGTLPYDKIIEEVGARVGGIAGGSGTGSSVFESDFERYYNSGELKRIRDNTTVNVGSGSTYCDFCDNCCSGYCASRSRFTGYTEQFLYEAYVAGRSGAQFSANNYQCGYGDCHNRYGDQVDWGGAIKHENSCELKKALDKAYKEGVKAKDSAPLELKKDQDSTIPAIETGTGTNSGANFDTNVAKVKKAVEALEDDETEWNESWAEGKKEQLELLTSEYVGGDEETGGINYADQDITGIVYAWGNINFNLGTASRLHVTGALAAYGGNPRAKAEPKTNTGKVTINASLADLDFDPTGLRKLVSNSSGSYKVTMYAQY